MPVLSICKSDTSVSYCIWQITETEAFFWQELKLLPEDAAAIRALQLPVRRLERLACRAALSTLLPRPITAVTYSPDGAPRTPDMCMSFSHCKNYVAVAIAPRPVGIDIEPVAERILNLYPKFLSNTEQADFNVADASQLHLCWGAKEACFKCIPNASHDFLCDIRIEKTPTENLLKGYVQTPEGEMITKIEYSLQNDLMVVICSQ